MLEQIRKFFGSQIQTKRIAGESILLFVHGLGGSAEGTWREMLRCVELEEDLRHCAYDCYAYPTSVWRPAFASRKPGINELADGLATYISVHYPNHSRIILVGHSLGGLVIRRYLLSILDKNDIKNIAGVVLYGTPSHGSSYAHFTDALSLNHEQAKQLLPNSDALDALNREWESRKVEEKVDVLAVVGGIDGVVNRKSASLSSSTKVHTLINAGHREIIRPAGIGATSFRLLVQHVLKVSPIEKKSDFLKKESLKVGDPLFDIYTQEVDEYYLIRDVDKALSNATISTHLWVNGPSGTGKTAALKRLAVKKGWKLEHLLMSSYENADASTLVAAICNEMYERAGRGDIIVLKNSTLDELILHFNKSISLLVKDREFAILVEELPFGPGEAMTAFMKIIYHLMQSLQRKQDNRVVILISSITNPNDYIDISLKHFRERMQFVQISCWTKDEMSKLLKLIRQKGSVKLTLKQVDLLATESNGSPRFAKRVLRKLRNNSMMDFQETIEESKSEQV